MSQSLARTFGILGNDLWNKQDIEGEDMLLRVQGPLRSEFYQSSWLP